MSNSERKRNPSNTIHKQLIIGAGFVGLGMAQALKEGGIAYDQVDASDDLGGNWHHGVYETAHIISSRKVTEFSCFPMPESYPDFPSRENMRDYIHSFAEHFDLRSHVELNRQVVRVLPVEDNLWQVSFDNGEERLYKGVVMCNGHHWCKRFPEFEGKFDGEIIHSKDYKKPQQLQNKKVLVIGGGNSACDIASEAARVGSKCTLSMRDSVWFIPKTFMGIPVADLGKKGKTPAWYQRLMTYILIRLTFGQHETYGMPKPKHRIYDRHPTINNEVPYYIKHGRIIYKPGVHRLDGKSVEFTDGSRDEFDLIVCATGYYVAYPFLPPELQRVKGSVVQCYGDSFLDDYKGLAYIGWYQPRSGIGSVLGAFAPIFARYLKLQDEINIPLGLVLKEIGKKPRQTHLIDPNDIYQEVEQAERNFDKIAQQASQIDAKYPNFHNQPLAKSNNI
ncbi:NAD(P)-binding domain-containing protein [Waterburya agarophytonicola K14]|uniref:NAD(P)-binding domain-containing protein n=1 Tax=Waterburya agarophytonicola KI4 TaxID=2874699 RepID=A0A964BP83_9CYAN|nr:NAD(P)/FAD-dependent oxidoreductase [Waterburya agarophytonicola]MCC0176332.1 NAD(P)-binding domain-containing protein [Waterburya agarophytonicola KI4]